MHIHLLTGPDSLLILSHLKISVSPAHRRDHTGFCKYRLSDHPSLHRGNRLSHHSSQHSGLHLRPFSQPDQLEGAPSGRRLEICCDCCAHRSCFGLLCQLMPDPDQELLINHECGGRMSGQTDEHSPTGSVKSCNRRFAGLCSKTMCQDLAVRDRFDEIG